MEVAKVPRALHSAGPKNQTLLPLSSLSHHPHGAPAPPHESATPMPCWVGHEAAARASPAAIESRLRPPSAAAVARVGPSQPHPAAANTAKSAQQAAGGLGDRAARAAQSSPGMEPASPPRASRAPVDPEQAPVARVRPREAQSLWAGGEREEGWLGRRAGRCRHPCGCQPPPTAAPTHLARPRRRRGPGGRTGARPRARAREQGPWRRRRGAAWCRR
jgi:hypothetical protein